MKKIEEVLAGMLVNTESQRTAKVLLINKYLTEHRMVKNSILISLKDIGSDVDKKTLDRFELMQNISEKEFNKEAKYFLLVVDDNMILIEKDYLTDEAEDILFSMEDKVHTNVCSALTYVNNFFNKNITNIDIRLTLATNFLVSFNGMSRHVLSTRKRKLELTYDEIVQVLTFTYEEPTNKLDSYYRKDLFMSEVDNNFYDIEKDLAWYYGVVIENENLN